MIPHGGSLHQARHLFPLAPEPWLDLSTGINPHAYPVPPADPARLPEPAQLAALLRCAADAYGVPDPACVAAAPGTQPLIGLLPLLFPYATVRILAPTYAEHAQAWGAAAQYVGSLDALDGAAAAVLCHPNNPDGQRHNPAALHALADRMAARGGLLVIDEAFADFEPPGFSLAAALPHPAIVILRSFGKTYGLAGIRLGFALAAPARIARMRQVFGPWPVSNAAIATGLAALPDAAWRVAHRPDAPRLAALLHRAGLQIVGGTPLFRLATGNAPATFDRLGRAGILVRRFADRPDWLRFGVPGQEADWVRLERALVTGG